MKSDTAQQTHEETNRSGAWWPWVTGGVGAAAAVSVPLLGSGIVA